jgi:thioredoxin reductase (NADPH)
MTAIPDGRVPVATPPELDPSDPYARAAETFPRLTDEQVARVAAFGTEEALPAGTVLFERDDRSVDFFLVLEGHIEIYETGPDGEPQVMTIHAEHQFTGEIDLFNDRAILVGGRMGVDGRVVRLGRAQFRRLLAAEPDIADIVMRAFILRRAGFIQHGQAAVTVVGPRRSADSLRIQRFLSRNGHPFVALDPDVDPEAVRLLEEAGVGVEEAPIVLCGPGVVLVRPSTQELGDCLGISEPLDPTAVADVVVVGAGPSGLAAAVYAASEGLDTLVLESEAPGGQAGTSSRIENYLGFPTGVSGQALASRAQVQAQKFGARIAVPRRVERLHVDERPYAVELTDGSRVRARTVVIATGARYRKLAHLEHFERFEGSGIHYAATAVEAGLCESEEVVVVGGGNSAGQAAVFLSRHASHVHVLVRGASLAASMSDYLVGRLEAVPERITLHLHTEITALAGDRHLERVTWTNRRTGEQETRPVANVFLMLGALPNTEWVAGAVAVDDKGFIRTGTTVGAAAPGIPALLETSRPGVFAVGDVRAGSVKRVASAVGEGSIVVSSVHQALAAA